MSFYNASLLEKVLENNRNIFYNGIKVKEGQNQTRKPDEVMRMSETQQREVKVNWLE